MPLTSGARLGSYEIVSVIGAGGMGEVYRARDTSLNRDVAIKIIPDLFAADPERLARFSREAQTLASLNHPNIAHVYGLEGAGLVMELVEGEDLAERISRGALPLDDVLSIATQIADALEAAHERGIIHRDLKPANIKVRIDGVVKVLDFGLAKARDAAAVAPPDGNSPTFLSPTVRANVSQQGVILGTAAYMSPEQAKGKPVDKRTDIWAFGCVLFEMLTGKMVFPGDNITDILAAVVRGEPDWSALPDETPASVHRLLRRCLSKDAKDRLSDIGVARLEIRDATEVSRSAGTPSLTQSARRASVSWGMLAAGLVAGAVIAGTVAWRMWPVPRSLPALKLTIEWPEDVSWDGPSGPGVAISPDGTHLAYVAVDRAGPQVYVRDLRGDDVRIVSSSAENPYNPFFSPDSSQIGFVSSGRLWRTAVTGGQPFEIGPIDTNDRGVVWSADGYIYSGGGSGISRMAETGGPREQITTVDRSAGEVAHRFPSVVAGTRAVPLYDLQGLSGGGPDRNRRSADEEVAGPDGSDRALRRLLADRPSSLSENRRAHGRPIRPNTPRSDRPIGRGDARYPLQQRRCRALQRVLDGHLGLHPEFRETHGCRPAVGGPLGENDDDRAAARPIR